MSQEHSDTISDTKTDTVLQRVRSWTVVFLNDDVTPMNFVTEVLMVFMHLSQDAAEIVMLTVHEEGRANVGVFSRDVAETKVMEITEAARQYGFTLQVAAEPIE